MKLVYTHENKILVENIKNILELEGVSSELKNVFSSGAAGELSTLDSWPEIWVDERFYERAITVVKSVEDTPGEVEWECQACGEMNAQSFQFCWKCQTSI